MSTVEERCVELHRAKDRYGDEWRIVILPDREKDMYGVEFLNLMSGLAFTYYNSFEKAREYFLYVTKSQSFMRKDTENT